MSITRLEHVTNTLFKLHMQKKNTRKVSQAFPCICEYIFEISCSKRFLKTSVFYAGNKELQRKF